MLQLNEFVILNKAQKPMPIVHPQKKRLSLFSFFFVRFFSKYAFLYDAFLKINGVISLPFSAFEPGAFAVTVTKS